jgi:hypothetical protein
VGARDIADIHRYQKARAEQNPPLRHFTRNFPKRAEELLDGGSMYWVITGTILVRQLLVGVERATEKDGTPTTALILDTKLVRVEARPMRAFQGWRYLPAADAPADLTPGSTSADMPEEMRRQLAALGLL